ncbi:ABC transporter ATP-binding protein, partial [Patescibacteria group bacterium]|nr:ABC transporter ATP-binding protein [Patescibacteria group bacterium]
MDMPLKNYSSGMQVRLAFSIAIMADADIYILDEVLAVGDIEFQKKCFNIFREYKKRKKTIILVTHSSSSVKDFCNRAAFLKDGKLHFYNTIDDVIKAYEVG